MTETIERQSATIYQFPKRGRFATEVRGDVPVAKTMSRLVKTVGGGAWYHDEAIADERKQ